MEIIKMKFSNKLSLVLFTTGMIVLIIVSFAAYKFSYASIMETQFKHTRSIAKEISDDLDQLLCEKAKTTLTLAGTPSIKKALETNNFFYASLSDEKRKKHIARCNDQWESTKNPLDNYILTFTDNDVSHLLKNQMTVLKGEYGEIFLTNKFGALVASTSKLSTFAHGHKYWWQGSFKDGAGEVFFDDRGYDDSVGGYVLGLVVPVRKESQIIGILKCNLNILGSVNKLISGAHDKLLGEFKLVRSGGMVVFEEGLEPLSTQVQADVVKQLKNNQKEAFIINDAGKEYLVGFSEIKLTKGDKGYGFGGTFESIDHKKGNTGESWYVLCYRPMSEIQAPIIESTQWILMIGAAMILILVFVSYLFGRKIAKPLAMLGIATEKIGKGEFEHKINLRQKDEFGRLAHSFNCMADTLEQTTTSITLLENEVAERKMAEQEREKSIKDLQKALENVNTLSGLLPICARCKKIRDDQGYWNNLEEYIQTHSDASFSHGLCTECSDKLYGNEDWYIELKNENDYQRP